jgi:hypothetical protein
MDVGALGKVLKRYGHWRRLHSLDSGVAGSSTSLAVSDTERLSGSSEFF